MKKITILTSYFGKFNDYFALWMQSVQANNSIDFKLITDNAVENVPNNMTLVKMTFEEVQNKIKAFFHFPVVVDDGYKMSEYQPLFALIFPELVKKADFWGYCEMDLILGNLRHFFTDEILNKYEKIYYLGHLTLYKNTDKINHLALLDHDFPVATFQQAFSTPYNYHFIEHAMRYIPRLSGVPCYEAYEFGDILYKYNHFVLAHGIKCDAPEIFKYSDGCIWRVYLDGEFICEEELSYVHLQKRKMSVEADNPEKGYLIVPNRFIDLREVTAQYIRLNAKDSLSRRIWYYKFYMKYYINTIKQGGIKIKLEKTIRKIKYGKHRSV